MDAITQGVKAIIVICTNIIDALEFYRLCSRYFVNIISVKLLMLEYYSRLYQY